MKPTQQLHDLGQSLWLDNITRGLLTDGTLRRYISEFSVTGLTSNPTIFDKAIKEGGFYDAAIRQKTAEGKSGETLFFELALADLVEATDQTSPLVQQQIPFTQKNPNSRAVGVNLQAPDFVCFCVRRSSNRVSYAT